MPLTLKPQYRWRDGHFQELIQNLDNVLSMPSKGTYVAVWNDFTQTYEFGESTGRRFDRRCADALPGGFRAALLLLGVS